MQQLELFAIAALNLITGKCESTQYVSCRQDMLALQITRKNSGRRAGDCGGGGRCGGGSGGGGSGRGGGSGGRT